VVFRPIVRLPALAKQNLSALASAFIVAGLIIAFLHIGREILLPLVIATLLAFILAPAIRRLRGLGLWNAPSVILTVGLAIVAIGGLGYTIDLQITQLAEDLPKTGKIAPFLMPSRPVNARTSLKARASKNVLEA